MISGLTFIFSESPTLAGNPNVGGRSGPVRHQPNQLVSPIEDRSDPTILRDFFYGLSRKLTLILSDHSQHLNKPFVGSLCEDGSARRKQEV